MATDNEPKPSLPFADFPEDVQLCILSFLSPPEISAFACTSKRSLSLCRNDGKLWFSICDRRWGSKTRISKWGSGKITFKQLYTTLHEYENLIGFWRRSGQPSPNTTNSPASPPLLVFFEWGPSFILGSKVSPAGSGYGVVKSPFLWTSISPAGQAVCYLLQQKQDEGCFKPSGFGGFLENCTVDECDLAGLLSETELIPVHINHMGKCHVVIEENVSSSISRVSSSGNVTEDMIGVESGSPPDRVTSQIYQYFANRTSPGGERRQRKREKGRLRLGKSKLEAEHFVKIVNCSPTASRPLQGLWKGVCEDMKLDFYLVTYDDIGGVACRRVGDSSKPFSSYSPVFWTPNTTFIDTPFSANEDYLYNSREHLRPSEHEEYSEDGVVSRILYINSSYDLVIPDSSVPTLSSWQVEGRIWQYSDGTFGFGFLRDNHIIDLKHIAFDGCVLDTIEPS